MSRRDRRCGRAAVIAVAAVAVVAMVAACGSTVSAGTVRAQQVFLAQVHANAPDIGSYRGDTQVLGLGHAVCEDLSSGVSSQQVADRIEIVDATHPLPSEDLGVVMTAAGETLCPKYADLFGSAGP